VSEQHQSSTPYAAAEVVAPHHQPVLISVREDFAVAHVAARQGKLAALQEQAEVTLGARLPETARVIELAGMTIVWAGPEHWLIIQPQVTGADPSVELAKAFNGLASVVDVSDSRVIFRVSGASATAALSKGVPIDLHDRAFKRGDVAITHAAHLGFMLWRLADGQGYDLACARTYSVDFRHWLERTCASRSA